ncbi:unnamed protein product [Oikopleura dioica]|uniref:SH3 domain-containing protein n=1 Tax=Oikopleura dioica TaxID=34765 RepID=E4WQP9_OIKDI|nr:unnamed protein product [Oikopleura dioica]
MEAEAIADYVQVQGDEFSLTVGQQINILDNSGDFYLADMEGEERYVPGNYVKLKRQVPWFLGHIERPEAEDILRNVPHGAFLVRNHQQKDPNVREKESPFSLSVKNVSLQIVQHYKINKSKEGHFWLYPQYEFASLNKLIAWYTAPHEDSDPHLVPVDLGYRSTRRDFPTRLAISRHTFKKEDTNELSFEANREIEVHEKIPVPQEGRRVIYQSYDDTEWFYGHIKGKPAEKGFFPRDFVDIV